MDLKSIQWAQELLGQQGYLSIAEPEIVRSMPWSEVLRFNTSKGMVYLKSMHELFAFEPRLINFLSQLDKKHLPEMIGVEGTRQSFLMKDAGDPLRSILKDNYDIRLSSAALQSYAQLQKNCIKHVEPLLSLGALDRRLAKLPDIYQEFISNSDLLESHGVLKSQVLELVNLIPIFEGLCRQLIDYQIPDTLEHGDFTDNNILVKNAVFTINDFGDASVSHPFFSLTSFLYSAKRNHGLMAHDSQYLSLRDIYLEQWSNYGTKVALVEAYELTNKLRVFVWLVSFIRMYDCPGLKDFPEYEHFVKEGVSELISNLRHC